MDHVTLDILEYDFIERIRRGEEIREGLVNVVGELTGRMFEVGEVR